MRKTRLILLLMAGVVCAAAAIPYLAHAVSGTPRTELYADQGQLRLTIAKVGKETDFLLPSYQEQVAAEQQQQQAQRAVPARFRPGEPYLVIRGFIEDQSRQPLAHRLTVGPTQVTDDAGHEQPAVHVTYSALRDEPSLSRIYEPPAQGQVAQQLRAAQRTPSNAVNIRSRVNVEPATQDAFLPPDLLAFAAFFRPLGPDVKRIDFRHTASEAQVQQSEDIRFENLTTENVPQEKLVAGYKVAIEALRHHPMKHTLVISFDRDPGKNKKTHELFVSLRVLPAAQGGLLPPSLSFTPPLVEDDMGDRAVCREVGVAQGRPVAGKTGKQPVGGESEKRELWHAMLIDGEATRFTITTRLEVATTPARREFVIRDIPVP